jgi:hypothetical protein
MNMRGFCRRSGIMLLLAVALLGSGAAAHAATVDPVTHRGASPRPAIQGGNADVQADPTLAAAVVTSSSSPPLSVATGGPSPVLRQIGPQEWETTVLLDDANPGCSDVTPVVAAADYRLTRSDRPRAAAVAAVPEEPFDFWLAGGKGAEVPGQPVAVEGQTASPATQTTLSLATGSSCEVTVAFTGAGLRQVPETAMLVLDQAGASSAIPLTVSRDVTLTYYLGIPAIVGGVMTLLLLAWSLLRIRVYGWDGSLLRPSKRDWWERQVLGSGAWALNDSWMTNITTGLVVVGTIASTASAANSLFPGLAVDRFAVVNIVAGAIVVAAPVVFAIKYAWFTARNPGPTADATFEVPAGRPVRIGVPSGASVTMSGDATVTGDDGMEATVRSGCAYQVPTGATIEVQAVEPPAIVVAVETAESEAEAVREVEAVAKALRPTAIIGFAGTSDIGVGPGTTLAVGGPAGAYTIQASDQLIPASPPKPADVAIQYPMLIDMPGGAKITVTGTADVLFPPDTVITAPRRRESILKKERSLIAPQGTNVLVGTMGMILAANFFTMFGIGAELGIAGDLIYFSEATQVWRVVMFCAMALVAILVLVYATTATRTMADPQPGSSLSSQAGTSFTL